jgi:hypothetical protein
MSQFSEFCRHNPLCCFSTSVCFKRKVKLSLCVTKHHAMKAYWRNSSTHSLISALDGGEWSASRPGRFTPRKRAPGIHWIGGWVHPRAYVSLSTQSEKFWIHPRIFSSFLCFLAAAVRGLLQDLKNEQMMVTIPYSYVFGLVSCCNKRPILHTHNINSSRDPPLKRLSAT